MPDAAGAPTDCKERLTASELDNNGGESGQEDASGPREWVLPIWRIPPAAAQRAAGGPSRTEAPADAGPAAPP